jgi:hypothetical protein
VAAAAHRLACEPALYFLSLEALRAELALPADHTIEFAAPSAVTLRFPKGSAVDLASALGLVDGVAMRHNRGAWSWRNWNMGTKGAAEDVLELWSPARVYVGLNVKRPSDDSIRELPLEDSTLSGQLSVSQPEAVLPIVDDTLASAMLHVAITQLAQEKERLAEDPAEVAKRFGLANDRFRLSRRTSSSGSTSIKGIDIWVTRSRVAAGPLIEALGLTGTIERSRANDSDEFLLQRGQTTEFAWRGLSLELAFDERTGAAAAGRHGSFVLDRVTLMP